jgi:hypothetical protein
MEKPDMIYFDHYDSAVKVCVPIAGQIREYMLPLQSKGRMEAIRRRKEESVVERARLEGQLEQLRTNKELELETAKNQLKQRES